MSDAIESYRERYIAAMHAVQSGVKFEIERRAMRIAEAMAKGVQPDQHDGNDPKHLRTGLNARASDHAALAHLLMKKGVINELEYFKTITEFMEAGAQSYSDRASQELGIPVQFK